jgi:hypothetical protein
MAGLKTKEAIFALAVVFLMLFLIRFSTNAINTRAATSTNIGVIPWSDAAGWVQGAERVSQGQLMDDFASRRPLYALFLSTLFALAGTPYLHAIIAQILLVCIAVTWVFQLFKASPERIFTAFFLSMLAIWEPTTQSVFLTENLGILLLIAGLTLIWTGLSGGRRSFLYLGLFFFGLSQAARPWAVIGLVTVPVAAIFLRGTAKAKIGTFLLCLLFVVWGYSFHLLATHLFARPDAGSNFAQTLYGQAAGGQGWRSASLDPVIAEAMRQQSPTAELNRIIYLRTFETLRSHPRQFINAAIKTYRNYLRNLPQAFESRWGYFLLCFGVLLFLEPTDNRRCLIQTFKRARWLWLPMLLVPFYFQYFGLFCFIVGAIVVATSPTQARHAFLWLYFLGVFLSLPFIGSDGGERVKISSDLAIYLVAGMGFQFLTDRKGVFSERASARSGGPTHALWIGPVAVAIFLLGVPFMLKVIEPNALQTNARLPELNAQAVAAALHLEEPLISPTELESLGARWPAPSFEQISAQTAFLRFVYHSRDALFLDADQEVSSRGLEFWPLQRLDPPAARTIHTRTWTLFPDITKSQLSILDGKEIIAVGTLLKRPRQWKYDTGYALVVRYVVWLDDKCELRWQSTEALKLAARPHEATNGID